MIVHYVMESRFNGHLETERKKEEGLINQGRKGSGVGWRGGGAENSGGANYHRGVTRKEAR